MPKITVAIPVYNAAKHLDILFDCLMNQTMPLTDFEILCVNDCSTDNSADVIMKYSQRMGNVVLINRTENSGGPVVPRNDAIAVAKGEYIHFMDNDDFLGEEALERLYRAASENKSDVIFGRYIGVNGRGAAISMFKKGNRYKADILADNLFYAIAPHKMFRLAFLKEHDFKFDTKSTAGNDDQLFVVQCFVAAKVNTVLADYPYYFIVARGNENLSSNFVPAEDWLYVWHRIMEYLDEYVTDEALRRKFKVTLFDRLPFGTRLHTFLLTSQTNRAQKEEWLKATKRLLRAHCDEEMIQALSPRYRFLWEAALNDDVDTLISKIASDQAQKQRSSGYKVTIKHAEVKTYKRPSTRALQASTSFKQRQELTVYPSIENWLELRRPGKDGLVYAEFIQKTDVVFSLSYLLRFNAGRAANLLRRLNNKIANRRGT